MNPEANNISENIIVDRGYNKLFYISSAITFCFLISVITFYWHAGFIEGGLGYPYDNNNKFPGLQFHSAIAGFLAFTWFLAFFAMLFIVPAALYKKRKVSWKALLFWIASQVTLFLYFKYSDFLGWIIT